VIRTDGQLSGYRWGVQRKRVFAGAREARMIESRLAGLNWPVIEASWMPWMAHAGGLLEAEECRAIAELYALEQGFRSRVIMARHGFGRGEYRYFSYPLQSDHSSAAQVAVSSPGGNRKPAGMHSWALSRDTTPKNMPPSFLAAMPQDRRNPRRFCLQYAPGDFNCLHQDIYGEHVFPLQPRSCCRSQAVILRRANRGDRTAPAHAITPSKCCRCGREIWWYLRCASVR